MSSLGGILGGSLLADPIDKLLGTGQKKALSKAEEEKAIAPSGYKPSNVPINPPNNSWEGMNFKTATGGGMPSTILDQFPQLQALFGGMTTGGGGGQLPPIVSPTVPQPQAPTPTQGHGRGRNFNPMDLWTQIQNMPGAQDNKLMQMISALSQSMAGRQ